MGRLALFLRNIALAALLVLPVFAASTTPAKAGPFDGIKGCMLAAEAAAEIAQIAGNPKLIACTGQLTSDPVLIALTVVMGALAANGNITSEGTCKALIYGSVANFFGEALLAAGVISQTDAETIKLAAANGSTEFVEGILTGLGIGQQIDCGCSIAGNAAEVVKLVGALAEHGQECAGMALAVGKELAEGVASGIYGVGEWVQGTGLDPCTTGSGGYIVETSFIGVCAPGKFKTAGTQFMYKSGVPMFATQFGTYNSYPPQWEDKCGLFDPSKQPQGYDPNNYPGDTFALLANGGTCYCPPGTTMSDYGQGYGKAGEPKSARCLCPAGFGYNAKGTCDKCSLTGQVVTSDGTCAGCPTGSVLGSSGTCEAACPAGQIMKGGSCSTCAVGTTPHYPKAGSSAGTCQACGPGTTAQPGELYCSNICNAEQAWVNGACKDICPAGQHPTYSNEGFSTGCKACSANTFWNGEAQTCQACPSGASWDSGWSGAGWCSCPAGQAVGASGKCTKCKGVVSSSPNGNICNACPGDAKWTEDGKGGGYCYAPRPFITCTGNSIPDKNAPYEKCVACPKNHYAYGGLCIPSGPVRAMTPNIKGVPSAADLDKTLAAFACPPGMKKLLGVCVPAGSGGIIADPDCSKLGSNYIKDSTKPGACKKCPMGRVANAKGDACVLNYSARPDAPSSGNINIPDTRPPPPNPGGDVMTPVSPQPGPERTAPQAQPQAPQAPQTRAPYTPPPTGGYTGQTTVPQQAPPPATGGNYKP